MSEEQKVDKDFADEIETAVTAACPEKSDTADDEVSTDSVDKESAGTAVDSEKEVTAADDDTASDDEKEKSQTAELPDELLERAVSLGMRLSDARKCPDSSVLQHICDRLQELGEKPSTEVKDQVADEKTKSIEKLLEGMPDFSEKDEDGEPLFDPKITTAFKTLTDLIKDQANALEGFLNENKNKSESDWIDRKLAGDKKLNSIVQKDASQKEKLVEFFGALRKGYDAAGKQYDKSALFDLSAKAVLGDKIAELAKAETVAAAEKRSKQIIQKPKKGGSGSAEASEADIVAELSKKFSLPV